MAVTIPPTGTGTATPVVATESISSEHYQLVKLVSGTATETARIGGDASNGLDVDVTRLPALAAGTNNIGDVDVLTVPAPLSTTGGGTEATALRVTVASDSTGVLSVDDNGASLTVDYATTGSGTATGALRVELPTNGTGVIATVGAVTAITNALPAGTNAIGKLAANTGVDIGDVDVTSINPGTSAGSLGKAEDAGHSSGDTGVMMLAVRNDTPGTLAGTDLDYAPPQLDSSGNLRVSINANTVGITVDTEDGSVAAGQSNAGVVVTIPYTWTGATHTRGGATIKRVLSAASTNGTLVKGAPAVVYGIDAINIASTVAYLKLYNKATAPTVGTTTVAMTIAIPANTSVGGHSMNLPIMGVGFSAGLGMSIVNGFADNSTAAALANKVITHVLYK